MSICPTCKQPVPAWERIIFDDRVGRVELNGRKAKLTSQQSRIFGCLLRKRGRTASRFELHAAMYFDRDDDSAQCISAQIHWMRLRLKKVGISIKASSGFGYYLTLGRDHD